MCGGANYNPWFSLRLQLGGFCDRPQPRFPLFLSETSIRRLELAKTAESTYFMAFLRVTDGPDAGRKYQLQLGVNVMGRHPDCELVLDVDAVSRQHAQIIVSETKFQLEDLNSRNHTFLNGVDIFGRGQQLVAHGDVVRICDVTFALHETETSAFKPPSKFPATDPLSVGSSEESFPSEESHPSAILVDDDAMDSVSSTIMSSVEVSTKSGQIQFAASPEAKLVALLEITNSLGKVLALDNVLPTVLDSLFKIFVQADRGFIGLKNSTGVLVPRWSKARRADTEDAIRVSRTIVNQVMESREAILSADAATDQRFEMSQSIAEFRIRSMMCAPLLDAEGNSLGVLQLDTLDQHKRFQQDDLDVLASVASQAGMAIDSAQMHERALNQQALERDLQLAHDVQKGFLPSTSPELMGYEFYDYYQPASHVGGDYYDYVPLKDGRVAVIVADVVGHGVAAALMMAKLSAEAMYCLASHDSVAQAVCTLNDRLSSLPVDRFVTLIMAVINPVTHDITIVNAGHMAPVLRSVDGRVVEPGLEESGLPLGIMEGVEYQQTVISLQAGEALTMYTDGLNEAMNSSNECYGIERMREHIANGNGSPLMTGNTIVQDVQSFVGAKPQDDDMCLVSLRRN